jgi:type III pantothenate kinase
LLLVVDIGNTNIVLGVFEGDRLARSWRVATRRDQTADEYAVLCRNLFRLDQVSADRVDAVVISSVVPPLNEAFARLAADFFGVEARFIEPERQTLMPVLYHHPEDVGADRIVNAIAARELYGTPAIIVDFGTATTFDAVSAAGEYLGGAIAPGIGISAEALFMRAARLPRVEIRRPERTVGRSTVESMQAGIFFGYLSLVEGMLERMKRELPDARVIATGGFARVLAAESGIFDYVEPDLTLYGLHICHRSMT